MMPMNNGVFTGLQSQIKCISLCALDDIDLKSSSESTSDYEFNYVCLRSGSALQLINIFYSLYLSLKIFFSISSLL
jgi:hypothetical protein